jgi:hypothetical protein
MKRFLMLVGVAVVAAAMYVAASPASQQSKGPTAKQFKALQKQVAGLSKTLKTDSTLIKACIKAAVPIDQFGDPDGSISGTPQGFHYGTGADPTSTSSDVYTTALDVSDPTDTGALWIVGGDSSCGTALGESFLHHASGKAGVRVARGLLHIPLLTAHQH